MNPVTLAFLGDAVLTLYIREKLALKADYPTGDLQKYTAQEVSAHGQNIALAKVGPLFTDTEKEIFRRGRNSKKSAKAKNASVAEYNNSTGFEAVLGYLYISGQYDRLNMILLNACSDFLSGTADSNGISGCNGTDSANPVKSVNGGTDTDSDGADGIGSGSEERK